MKTIILKSGFTLSLLLLFSILQSFDNAIEVFSAKVVWAESSHDFGSIQKGVPVSFDFEFQNSGNAPLLVSNVKTSCGCTVPVYPKEPIAPGSSEKIKVTYNAAKLGNFSKSIKVYTNAEEAPFALTIRGDVIQ